MNILEFAQLHNLSFSEEECGDHVIKGMRGHIYEYEPGILGVMVANESDRSRPRFWTLIRREFEKTGMSPIQVGDDEGCYSFDPKNTAMAETAIGMIGRVRFFPSDGHLGRSNTYGQSSDSRERETVSQCREHHRIHGHGMALAKAKVGRDDRRL